MKRILVVEDEQAIREMVGFALKKSGFQFEEVADAEQALLSVASRRPDLVLLDWMLPGMSGVDLARRLRRDEITGKVPHIDGPELLAENGDDSVRKLIEQRYKPRHKPFDLFISMTRAEWDTLMFFYGIILCVGGLGTLGYLAVASQLMYVDLGPTQANITVGLLSAVVDNIPVMFAVLAMQPAMDHGQWLLVTLTAGVGGSLLSIGSAAGVAVMGQARGIYTFFSHLKWTWAIALGYAASIRVHFLINARLFGGS
jgi:CheY-like chemotaxis protein